MGFTINKDNIIVNGNGVKVRTEDNIKSDEINWEEGILHMYDLGTIKYYKIYFSRDESEEKIFLRPKIAYHCGLFEEVFDFKCNCADYDENRIVSFK